jgi:ABC-type lipoprotein export system ATPase subunit
MSDRSMSDPRQEVIRISGGRKDLPDGRPLLRDLEWTAYAGESSALIGKSGSGKSSLLATLGLMDTFDAGHYYLGGVEMQRLSHARLDETRGSKIGFVFQRFSLIPHLSVLENVMAPLRHAARAERKNSRKRALDQLAAVGMSESWRKKPRQLSGGEQQRVAIARSLIRAPRLLLADEPTGSLDVATGERVIDLMLSLVKHQGICLVVVTHDLDIAARLDSRYELVDGTIRSLPSHSAAGSPLATMVT